VIFIEINNGRTVNAINPVLLVCHKSPAYFYVHNIIISGGPGMQVLIAVVLFISVL